MMLLRKAQSGATKTNWKLFFFSQTFVVFFLVEWKQTRKSDEKHRHETILNNWKAKIFINSSFSTKLRTNLIQDIRRTKLLLSIVRALKMNRFEFILPFRFQLFDSHKIFLLRTFAVPMYGMISSIFHLFESISMNENSSEESPKFTCQQSKVFSFLVSTKNKQLTPSQLRKDYWPLVYRQE